MPELTFFYNARHDGGIRTGIELDGKSTLLVGFQAGPPEMEDDPMGSALLWYVDIRCRGRTLPRDPEGAREWFLRNLGHFQQGLEELAEEIKAGTDDDAPLRLMKPPPGSADAQGEDLSIEYACSSIRRVKGRELADVVLDVSKHLRDHLIQVDAVVPVAW